MIEVEEPLEIVLHLIEVKYIQAFGLSWLLPEQLFLLIGSFMLGEGVEGGAIRSHLGGHPTFLKHREGVHVAHLIQ